MHHRKSGRRLNRTSAHRKAMFQNMAVSLLKHELIKTTVPKAKELRRFVEPLITMARDDSVANRRVIFSRLRDKAIVAKLFTNVAPRHKERPGGYLRILKCGFRAGDNAPMAIIELVDRQEHQAAQPAPAEKPKKAAKPKAEKTAEAKAAEVSSAEAAASADNNAEDK